MDEPRRASRSDAGAGPPAAARPLASPIALPPAARRLPATLMVATIGTLGLAAGAFVVSGTLAALAVMATGLATGALVTAEALRLDRRNRLLEARVQTAEAARQRAEADNLAKSRFLAEMSHELRTPLNTVMGFSEMMAEEVLGPHKVPAYGGYARDILASSRHLLALADDLLDLARIEAGHRVLLETPVDLGQLGQDCLTMLQPDAARRGIRLHQRSLGGGAARLWGDERALRQMALNLLTNAVKFTPHGGEVRLVTGLDGDGAPFLRVEDTGPGVSEGELPLEDARHRESRLDVTSGRGAGLGLAIVRALATLHGGTFTLMRGAGGGTSAGVSFPRARALPPRAA